MTSSNSTAGFSAQVRLELIVGDRTCDLAEIGPDSVYLRNPISLPPAEADVIMHVDGKRRVWRVYLPDGIREGDKLVKTEPASRAQCSGASLADLGR